ncbi:MAG: hypothetical protein M1834_009576 [Cirrosporium novae-zelandiae]|nr:MAG: hypothetical protein M1834_009576 [Cirrosporium novae-zelandiae]
MASVEAPPLPPSSSSSLPSLLSTLDSSLQSALSSLEDTSLQTHLNTTDGLSLFSTKNELLISYIQNLVFFIILKLRQRSTAGGGDETALKNGQGLELEAVNKLIELRVYLEKGVRPLERRLGYQIEKVLRAAGEADEASAKAGAAIKLKSEKEEDSFDLDKNLEEEEEEEQSEDGEEGEENDPTANTDDLKYRPNPSALRRPAADPAAQSSTSSNNGIYKPPRITPTALPTTTKREERASRKPNKSAVLDEFIADEYSTAPRAEAYVGGTIMAGGRRSKSLKERKEEAERRDYEETNFVRLPKGKKERGKQQRNGQEGSGGYGGEEWRGLGEGLDRIERLTQKRKGAGGALERSRKRAVEDGPRDDGTHGVGEMFNKRRKVVNRKRGRGQNKN